MKILPGPSAPPAPQRPAYAQAIIDASNLKKNNLHRGAIPPHSLVFGNLSTDLGSKPRAEDRLQPISACGETHDNSKRPFGVVQDSMLDLEAIHRHAGHRHVGVCVQGLVTLACDNENMKNAEIGDYLEIKDKGDFSFYKAPTGFKGLELQTKQSVTSNTIGKIYGFSSTQANEVEVLLL